MSTQLIKATETEIWRKALAKFNRVDVCQLPEYHLAYSTRTENSAPVMWQYQHNGEYFCYPFLLTPVNIKNNGSIISTGYNDISSIYGYSGPLSTSTDRDFLYQAWQAFDVWALENKVIADFTRFSIFVGNTSLAHKNMVIEYNRNSAVSFLPDTEDELLSSLGSKTRNMIRKAVRSNLIARELDVAEWMPEFRTLYNQTMQRNQAPEFFIYDDKYYETLQSLADNELRLFGVFHEDKIVAAAIALVYQKSALYHLGASLNEYIKYGAGNLSLFQMSLDLMKNDVEFLNIGGGRTTNADDPLFRFKKSNATSVEKFYIGKRIIDNEGYESVKSTWNNVQGTGSDNSYLQFYR